MSGTPFAPTFFLPSGVPLLPYLQPLLTALCAVNVVWLLNNPGTPLLYKSGCRYKREARRPNGARVEEWLTIPHILKRGSGDCEDLSGWLAAELQVKGILAAPFPTLVRPKLYHIRVEAWWKRGGGRSILDPSKVLGM